MLEALTPVDNTTLQERVYRTLKEAILEGRFSPGEQLPTRSLAEILGDVVLDIDVKPNRGDALQAGARRLVAAIRRHFRFGLATRENKKRTSLCELLRNRLVEGESGSA